MATIDKSLPNTLMEEELLNENPVDQMIPEEPSTTPSDVEILNTEDGGAEISFDPTQMDQPAVSHNSNLADYLDEGVLTELGSKLSESYQEYKMSRKD